MRFYFLFTVLLQGVAAQVWSCSSITEDGMYYLPGFEWTGWTNVFNARNDIGDSIRSWSFVYPIPEDIGCMGTVTAVEFCYKIAKNRINRAPDGGYLVFDLSTLSQNGNFFTVIDSIPINSRPVRNKCVGISRSNSYCCDQVTLHLTDQFNLPAKNFAFGVTTPSSSSSPNLRRFITLYRLEHFQKDTTLLEGMTYDFDDAFIDELRTLRFHLVPLQTTTAPPLTTLPSTTSETTPPTTPPPSTTSETTPPTTPPPSTTSETTTPPTTPPPSTTSKTTPPTTSPPSTTSETTPPTTMPTTQADSPSTTLPLTSSVPTMSTATSQVDTVSSATLPSTLSDAPTTIVATMPPDTVSFSHTTDILNEPSTADMSISSNITSDKSTLGAVPNTVLNRNAENVNNQNAAVGGAIGGVIAILLVLAACVLLIVFFFKHVKKVRKEINDDGLTFSNAVYVCDSENNMQNKNSPRKIPRNIYYEVGPSTSDSYTDGRKQNGIKGEELYYSAIDERKYATLPHEYEDAQMSGGQVAHPAEYEAVQPGNKNILNSYPDEEVPVYDDIYVDPANDVNSLYAQLEEIQTDNVCRDNIRLGNMLGSGQFGEVYKGVWERSHDNLEVAVKTLKKGSSEDDKVKFLQEAAIMGQFKHPNVVAMYGVVTDGEPILLVIEMLKKGDLRGYMLSMRTGNDEVSPEINGYELLSYCHQVASGMAYLSNKAFVHRDLAARNILVSDGKICKIADFGMSRDLADENYYISHGGMIPVKWTAPEALHYKKYSTASDVWSFGIVMYEIWSVGHKPFEGVDNAKVLRLLGLGYRLPPPPGCPRSIYSVMMSCWHPELSCRPNFLDLSRQLSTSTSKLLHWSNEEKMKFPEASKLGANLHCSKNLYQDIQIKYKKDIH